MIVTRSKGFVAVLLLCCINFEATAGADWMESQISQKTEVKYERDCDSLVNNIRADTRARMNKSNSNASIEQVYDRETIEIADDSVICRGIALLSNGLESSIEYGAYIDKQGDVILHYK